MLISPHNLPTFSLSILSQPAPRYALKIDFGVLVSFCRTEKMWGKLSENQHLSHILSTCYQCSSHNIPIPTHYQLFNHFIPINYQLLNKLSSFSPLQNQHSIKRSTLSPHFILCNVSAFWKILKWEHGDK